AAAGPSAASRRSATSTTSSAPSPARSSPRRWPTNAAGCWSGSTTPSCGRGAWGRWEATPTPGSPTRPARAPPPAHPRQRWTGAQGAGRVRARPARGGVPLRVQRRVGGICARFEAAWRDGRRPRLDEHLGELPDAERPALLAELLRLEVYYRSRAGESLTAGE